MKKIIILASILALSSCMLFNSKRHEEFQYFSFNEKTKATVRKGDISLTMVTKVETLNAAIDEVKTKYNGAAKQVGTWDFSQKPSKTLKDEITNKAVELGANYIILFEKKDCDNIDLKKGDVDAMEGTNCYRIVYYYTPEDKVANTTEVAAPATAVAPTPTKTTLVPTATPAKTAAPAATEKTTSSSTAQ